MIFHLLIFSIFVESSTDNNLEELEKSISEKYKYVWGWGGEDSELISNIWS